MSNRVELQSLLESLLESRNVYFQPPENIKINYPCIVYRRDSMDTIYADDLAYRWKTRYQLTLIDRDPDSKFIELLAQLPMCKYDRHYTSDNLNHEIFTIYY